MLRQIRPRPEKAPDTLASELRHGEMVVKAVASEAEIKAAEALRLVEQKVQEITTSETFREIKADATRCTAECKRVLSEVKAKGYEISKELCEHLVARMKEAGASFEADVKAFVHAYEHDVYLSDLMFERSMKAAQDVASKSAGP